MRKVFLNVLSISFICLFIMSLFFSVSAYYEGSGIKKTTIDGKSFQYRVIDNKYVQILKGEDFIPGEINGCPVTRIGDGAYSMIFDEIEDAQTKDAKKWNVPDTVNYIGDSAFANNYTVSGITIPSSINYIGTAAFYNCVNLKKITLPDSIETVPPRTFKLCKNLTDINLPDSLWSVENEAFRGCNKLEKFVVPKCLTVIKPKAFMDCRKLKVIDYSKNSIGAKIESKAIGYYEVIRPRKDYDITVTKQYKVKGVKILLSSKNNMSLPLTYASENGLSAEINIIENPKIIGSIPAGAVFKLKIDGKKTNSLTVKKNRKIKKINSTEIAALQSGKAKFTTKTPDKTITSVINVQGNPKLEYLGANGFVVKKGKTKTVKLYGKVKSIRNKYTSTKKAKIISKKNSSNIKIKGLKKGTTTLKVKVNGVKTLKLKVNII